MAGASSHCLVRQVQRLFQSGAGGTMSDLELLDRFLARQDEFAEAAFKELMIRHGPMVLRVCHNILRDANDAEDAFQAVFLVLANRAGSIRRHGSLPSWLFGVAQRVACRARSRASRQRSLDRIAMERTKEGYIPPVSDPDQEILHEEIAHLPERLRAPLVLCDLEGLTYEAAARQLDWTEGTLRGRLRRARERLRCRLIGRGVAISAWLPAVASVRNRASIPAHLVHATARIALGSAAGQAAAVLAHGVLKAMLVKQLKAMSVFFICGVGSSVWLWHAMTLPIDDTGRVTSRAAAAWRARSGATQTTTLTSQQPAAPVTYRMEGVVRVEETAEPVAGVKWQVFLTDPALLGNAARQATVTDADGRFAIDAPAGHVWYHASGVPAGYWLPDSRSLMDSIALGSDQPSGRRQFSVRKGTVWDFRFSRGACDQDVRGYIEGSLQKNFQSEADDRGLLHLTLPSEGRKGLRLSLYESAPETFKVCAGSLEMSLDWEPGFQPDHLVAIKRLYGDGRRFRLVDAGGSSATIEAPDSVEPVSKEGRLMIRVELPERGLRTAGNLTGQVLDHRGRPLSGADVSLLTRWESGGRPSDEMPHRATTNAQGRYVLRDIPRQTLRGQPLNLQILVSKPGYASLRTPPFTLVSSLIEEPQHVEPICLERSVALRGRVIDHRGRPVVGAWVRPGPTRTDGEGRFTVRNLRRGLTQLRVYYGRAMVTAFFTAAGSSEEALVRIPDETTPAVPEDFLASRLEPW